MEFNAVQEKKEVKIENLYNNKINFKHSSSRIMYTCRTSYKVVRMPHTRAGFPKLLMQ